MSGEFETHEEQPGAVASQGEAGAQDGDQRYDGGQDSDLTGDPAVDEVLRTMQGLQGRPVDEHVAVFEAAHEKLRAALAQAGDRPSGPPTR